METFGREARVLFPIRNAVATRYPPVATWTLVAINCAVFLLQLSLGPGELEQFLSTYAVIPARYFYPDAFADGPQDLVPFLTMMLLHGGWLHLILNMWTLWLFGGAVEDRMGSAAISRSIWRAASPPPWRMPSSIRPRPCRLWAPPARSPA
jgi:membrane associated rhomboid family serine protease